MINKQSLWFITLFSLILILGIYYVSMPSDALTVFSGNNEDNSVMVNIKETDALAAIKASEEEKLLEKMESYQNILLDSKATTTQKNEAFEMLELLNNQKGKTTEIQRSLRDEFKIDCVVTMENKNITITISGEDRGNEFANNIIKKTQSFFNENMYITVKFK